MKFSEMPYERPDTDELRRRLEALTAALTAAASYEDAKKVFLEEEKLSAHIQTLYALAYIRHSINTKDEFYDGELKFWNAAMPALGETSQAWTRAMLDSPYRPDFTREYGDVMFRNAEIEFRSFSPAIIPELQEENDLTQAYEKLLASAQIPFEGGTYTLSQLSPFKNDPDDARRSAAWEAEGNWYLAHREELDTIYGASSATRTIFPSAMTAWGATAIPKRMWRNSAPPSSAMWSRSRTASIASRQSGSVSPIP